MTTIYADFNARTRDDRVRLTTAGSKESLASTGLGAGAWVWLSDGEVRTGALIEDSKEGLVAQVVWETLEDVAAATSTTNDISDAVHALRGLMRGTERDYKRILRALPFAESALDAGQADYFRSRAAQAFGYPHLALLAIDDALRKAPSQPGFVRQRLEVLKSVDLDRAFEEARALAGQKPHAVTIAACASIYSAKARQLNDVESASVEKELLALTDEFDTSPGHDLAPHGVASTVYVTRGFAFIHLGNRDRALEEFDRAVAQNPDSAEALAARGLETYPASTAVMDLERSVALGFPSYWPTYYLSHYYMNKRNWPRAEQLACSALGMVPPPRVRANLIEWQAIARFQQDGDIESARGQLQEALFLAPDNKHFQSNLALLDDLATSHSAEWLVIRDAEKQMLDLAA